MLANPNTIPWKFCLVSTILKSAPSIRPVGDKATEPTGQPKTGKELQHGARSHKLQM
jgi:hypothetical protein